MRLLSLALERYGAFTDRAVRFREDARLHVVLGANEAGKSTALAAVTDLLFGIEERTRYAFHHEMPQLRLGAEIAAADGRRLAFRRRKGRGRTLIDAAETALPDDALAPFLGGISRTVFCRAFGLDAAALRAGGREMVDVEGEVGASLFAAGSGLRGLTDLQEDLDREADGIYAPRRAGHRVFYQALDRYDGARKAIRETGLRAGDWRALNDEIAEAAGQLDAVGAERVRLATERARLERLKRAAPLLAGIDALEARLAEEAGLVEADAAWIERLGAALEGCRTAGAEAARADAARTRSRAEAEAVPVDAALTARAEEILEAFRGIDRFDKDGIDLPRVGAEADRLAADLDRLRARVGVPDFAALSSAQPSDAARARIERLLREARSLDAAEAQLARDRDAARAEHDRLAAAVEAAGAVVDPAPLREMLRPFARLREVIARHADLDGAIRHETLVLRNAAGRLSPTVADTAALARAPLPSAEAIGRFRALLDAAERERDRLADRCEAATARVAEIAARLREREAGRPVATRERLDALRAAREDAFAPLRDALAAGTGASAAAVAAFERAALSADALADERAADAARVAEQAADAGRLAAARAEAEAAGTALAEAAGRLAEGEAAWREAWAAAGIAPHPPAEMATWLSEAESLIETEQEIARRRIEGDRLGAEITAARAPLAGICARAGLDDLAGLDVGAVLARAEERVALLGSRREAGLESAGLLRAAAAASQRLDAALAETGARRAAWRDAWAGAVAALGLDGGAAPEEAEGALAAWHDVPGALAQHADLHRRVAGIGRDREAYRAAVAALVGALAPDLAEMPPSAGIRTLHGRLVAAQARTVRRAELDRRREEAERAAAAAVRERDAAGETLRRSLADAAPELAGAPLETVAALHGRLGARARLRDDLARLRGGLAGAADGLPEADLRAGLADLPPEAIEAELARLATEAEAVEERGRFIFADRDRNERRRAALEGGTGAELALAERKGAEADLASAARSWAVLRLAGLMLGHAVARHRAGQQDPLVARAGALFRALTGGGFEGLAQSYDDDTPRLAGRRAGGGLVGIEGLSEGTRDQLYLALRLAYLEDYAARAEPAPFIGDDLFSTFDDARTGHGLAALAEIGGAVQPILFTHHRHVAEIARDRLGDAVDVLEL
ncbi:AAA family ATPase [Methylobacterium sp. NEAU 140]|uniref:YhaN family protein n=1 Tax=Methylobacterium sp. NEAU 140 TaxID=3064945 RepID=UPI0027357E15|nr:YhaN family protein [Methylobacterium sp. NEAU 140]MDP4023173.1 AAA family ATPase [Methylobacterium sp. NEAU 140]